MKKSVFVLILMSLAAFSFAKSKKVEKAAEEPDTYEYDQVASTLEGVKPPRVEGDYIIFTAPATARTVGIAFDFENFRQVHQFKLYKTYSYEGEVTGQYFFYIAERPKKTARISYRLIIDGLWTTDPQNSNVLYDATDGYTLSYLDIDVVDPIVTEKISNGLTKFVCFAPSGQKIRLGGTFTNWDSWIYEMQEVAPGRYEIAVPLHPGTYYYAYYNGITSFVDSTNPLRGYSSDGRVVSRITIN